MSVEWGSVAFFKKLIRFALFVVLPTSLVALLAMIVLYIVQVSNLNGRIHDLETRIGQLEAQASAKTVTHDRLVLERIRTLQANAKQELLFSLDGLRPIVLLPDETDVTPDETIDLPSPTPSPTAGPSATPGPDTTPPLGTDASPTPIGGAFALFPDFHQTYPTFAAPLAKVAYLTFDDGPSDRTLEILDILDRYKVKAAFFVLDHSNIRYADIMREVVRRGNAIGMHGASHNYTTIYASVDSFLRDFESNYRYILSETGVAPAYYRFPGGSSTSFAAAQGAAIRTEMARRGFAFYDWNSSSGDGNSANQDPAVLAANVLSTAKGKSRVIVLAHDTADRRATVAALPTIIEGLQAQGFRIELLTPDVRPIAFKVS
jgi:peptidoglycan/xylan/chitin deacetylase (PgdA/CDA1 family)